ncbi:nucleotidyltransferase domain-containing protein [Proteiniclasticum sp.]|uniref:nucleotidyltransferase domain-containing protein n=1 Tax=Proteiniclasticum sp. TaxID=2053595 RepID=UPI002899323A|nr:nucleotidyltransferase domain-containing protein [Proteiniclasticum sp.]
MKIDLNNPRVLLAHEIRESIRDIEFDGPELLAMAVGGSVSRGQADAFSDLELLCFWDVFPDVDTRQKLVDSIKADLIFPIDDDQNEDNLILKDIQIDILHNTVDYYDNMIEDAWEFHLADYQTLGFLDTITYAYPLFGNDILNAWKDKTKIYPRELAINVIFDNLVKLHNGNIELYIQRDNPTEYYAQMVAIQRKLFNILSAINKTYAGGYKWMYPELESMTIAPVNVAVRYKEMFSINKFEAVEDLYALVFETLILVKQQFPEVDFSIEETFDKFMIKRLPL